MSRKISNVIAATIEVGRDNDVVIRFNNRMNVITAKALRISRSAQGHPERIVLDRLIHERHEQMYGDFRLSGCVVTELTREQPKPLTTTA